MSKRKHNREISCEMLENRRMFVTYQVNGTNGNDAISISISGNSIISAVNGVSDSGSDIINNSIEINGLGGHDTISIVETGSNNVTVNGGSGNDTINLGNGGNSLDPIDGRVTVNGDAGADTTVLFSQNQTLVPDLMLVGDEIWWNLIPMLSTTAEAVTLNVSAQVNQTTHIFNTFDADITLNGNSARTQTILIDGTNAGTYSPDGSIVGKGSIDYDGTAVNFTQCDVVSFHSSAAVTVVTPNANDSITLTGSTITSVAGNSGGIGWTEMRVDNVGTLTLDVAAHDAGAGNDSIGGSFGHPGAGTLRINAGTGSNSLNATGGAWNVTSAVGGIGGANLDINASNSANVTLVGNQTLHRIQIDDDGTVGATGSPATLSTQQLAVVSGTGTLNVNSPNTVIIPSSTAFSIGAGRTLLKKGTGTLTVSAAQSHGTGATFESRGGTTTFSTDCGSTTSRPLNLVAKSGTINFGATQHVNSVIADAGIIAISLHGSRVLVTNSASTGSEGGAINLNDNDMIVDYTTAVEADGVYATLHSGFSNGSWDGLGINSATAAANPGLNTALGSLQATDYKALFGNSIQFDGQTIDNTAVLIKYTYYGDVDFNGQVDTTDYNIIDFGFLTGRDAWANGDVDGNGQVDTTDYNLIDFAFLTQSGIL